MIRPLSFLVLLGASTIVLAQPLYKWVEVDGSITFSVKPPPTGISYETVDPAPVTSSPTDESQRAQMAPVVQQTKPSTPAVTAGETPQLLAPQLGVQRGIRRSQTDSNENAPPDTNNLQPLDVESKHAAVSAKSRKLQQCEDLRKRVVSLERRLKSRLTPDDMDNTVVHMARYQRSYDQHCVQ